MSEFLFSIACTCISPETTGGSHVQVHSVPELLCRILAWLGSSYWFFRIMELSDVYVNDNDLDKFHQNYCRTHWPYQGMACEVKDCGTYIYPTLRKYMRHLHRIHKDHQDLLVCHRCTQNFVKIYSLTRHLQSDHDLLLAVSKEMAAEASVIKKKLTNSSTLRGILFRQYFGKTTTKLRRTTRIRQ